MSKEEKNNNKPIWLYVLSLIVLFGIVFFIYIKRFDISLDAPMENWVDTASYFNGILTPPLLAITSILIFLTWQTSKKELQETKSLLEDQGERETHKFSLELFSRRVSELSERFESKEKYLYRHTSDTFKVINFIGTTMQYNNLAEKLYPHFLTSFKELFRVKRNEELNLNKQDYAVEFILNYLMNHKASLNEIVRSYECSIETSDNLIHHIEKNIQYPEILLERIVCYFLFKQETLPFEINTFYLLINKIIGAKEELKITYIEELLMNFDNKVAKKLIELNPDIPNDVLDY